MKRWLVIFAASAIGLTGSVARSQAVPAAAQTIKGPDERFKTDILVVVAHPDDEGGVTPYLARAIYDEHKRVAVVFTTRGGSGGNDYTQEHGPALADIREQEARQACARLGITNVWFLDGKDTASQNVLNSLANWGHGANLEALVRIVRLTRPEVIISWLPGIFIGENHGDHQASGVLATEAFDLANDPAAFPAQVAGASKRLEIYLKFDAVASEETLLFQRCGRSEAVCGKRASVFGAGGFTFTEKTVLARGDGCSYAALDAIPGRDSFAFQNE